MKSTASHLNGFRQRSNLNYLTKVLAQVLQKFWALVAFKLEDLAVVPCFEPLFFLVFQCTASVACSTYTGCALAPSPNELAPS